eukprot:scaffold60107_cov18-Prasinocladus_malaysianus.AAC.1
MGPEMCASLVRVSFQQLAQQVHQCTVALGAIGHAIKKVRQALIIPALEVSHMLEIVFIVVVPKALPLREELKTVADIILGCCKPKRG